MGKKEDREEARSALTSGRKNRVDEERKTRDNGSIINIDRVHKICL